jgi:hypothetical protein
MQRNDSEIHVVEKKIANQNLRKVRGARSTWESGYWIIADSTAKLLLNGTVFIHRGQRVASHSGGRIISIFHEPGTAKNRRIIRFVFDSGSVGVLTPKPGWGNERKLILEDTYKLVARKKKAQIEPISINWLESIETLKLDMGNPETWSSLSKSTEYWPIDGSSNSYNFVTQVEKIDEFNYRLKIQYLSKLNSHLKKNEYPWGLAELELCTAPKSGRARWQKESSPRFSKWHDIQFEWPFFHGQRKKIMQSVAQREQEKFRRALLAFEPICALTGETTQSVLEGAHIISVADNGADNLGNGILLRADLHRLYDAREFSISVTGKVQKVGKKVSTAYQALLKRSNLTPSVLGRVSTALLEKEKLGKKGSR